MKNQVNDGRAPCSSLLILDHIGHRPTQPLQLQDVINVSVVILLSVDSIHCHIVNAMIFMFGTYTHIHFPVLMKCFAYVSYMCTLVIIFVFAIYMTKTCGINIVIGCVLADICKKCCVYVPIQNKKSIRYICNEPAIFVY